MAEVAGGRGGSEALCGKWNFVGQDGFLGGRRRVEGFVAWSRGAMLLGVPG